MPLVVDVQALLLELFEEWQHIAPQARVILDLLEARGETASTTTLMDHLALRTFDAEGITLDELARPFLQAGWTESGRYRFVEKKLVAKSFSPPVEGQPRVFVSQLARAELDAEVRALVDEAIQDRVREDALVRRPSWPAVSFDVYRHVAEVSEYAAWVLAFGIRANHFTLDVGKLQTVPDLRAALALLDDAGLPLNGAAPGRSEDAVQGSPQALLEQGSTKAPLVEVRFAGGQTASIPGCYVELAQRHLDPTTGHPYDGFLEKNADKIFESTYS